MNSLEQFAKEAGVSIHRCDAEWGGTYGFKCADHPNTSYNGYKTERKAYEAWARDTFGEKTSQALVKLLEKI